MNITAQCCGLVLLVVLLVFYLRQKRIKLHTEKAFQRVWAFSLLNLSLDILSVVFISNMESIPLWLVDLVCKFYVASIVATAMSALVYVLEDAYSKHEKNDKKKVICFITGAINTVIIFACPITIVNDGAGTIYTKGPSVMLAYFFGFCIFLALALVVEFNRHSMNPRRKEAVRIWIGMWFFAAAIQFVNSSLLFIGFAGAVGVMVLYVLLENPQLNIDQETGLFNQSGFHKYLEQLFDRKEKFEMICMMVPKNTTMRHGTYELMLQEIYDFLQSLPGAMVFHHSDDEVFILFSGEQQAEKGITQIKEYFHTPVDSVKSNFIQPGFIHVKETGMIKTEEDILNIFHYIVDSHPQYDGDHFYEVTEPQIRAMYEEKEVEKLIHYAIENDRVEVFFQPIYSNRDKKFVSAEALARIRDKDGKLIPPMVFIGVAEKNGLILQLGEAVFKNVCRFIKERKPEQYGLEYIEVNLSVVQCSYSYLAKSFMEIMRQYGVNPGFINLEITESATFESKKNLLENMATLREEGVRFSLDDFGSGQSNLNYIVDMPVDIVKFDRDMTTAYFENGKAKHVMNAAVEMIHGMNLEIVSEGVETEEQFCRLEKLGIRFIQGYYFSRPLEQDAFIEFLAKNAKVQLA